MHPFSLTQPLRLRIVAETVEQHAQEIDAISVVHAVHHAVMTARVQSLIRRSSVSDALLALWLEVADSISVSRW
jgi:hypothetical protein